MKKYLLIILTMAVAYGFSSYAGTSIFVDNTPRVNRNYLADLQNKFKKDVNKVYLAFSTLNQKLIKKNIAVVYPTLAPAKNNMSGKLGSPTAIPPTTKIPDKLGIAKIDPATIPANLFKSFIKGVSAYEEEDRLIFRIDSGTTYKVDKIVVGGKEYKVIHLTTQ